VIISRRRILFNGCDQPWNADRLGQKWMSLDLQGDLASAFVTRGGQKDNGVRCDIRSGSIRAATFAAVHFRHRNISRQKVYETILEAVRERIETREQQGESQTPWRALVTASQTPQMP
jgi:hypothetical protein